jgi:hypothetical protein
LVAIPFLDKQLQELGHLAAARVTARLSLLSSRIFPLPEAMRAEMGAAQRAAQQGQQECLHAGEMGQGRGSEKQQRQHEEDEGEEEEEGVPGEVAVSFSPPRAGAAAEAGAAGTAYRITAVRRISSSSAVPQPPLPLSMGEQPRSEGAPSMHSVLEAAGLLLPPPPAAPKARAEGEGEEAQNDPLMHAPLPLWSSVPNRVLPPPPPPTPLPLPPHQQLTPSHYHHQQQQQQQHYHYVQAAGVLCLPPGQQHVRQQFMQHQQFAHQLLHNGGAQPPPPPLPPPPSHPAQGRSTHKRVLAAGSCDGPSHTNKRAASDLRARLHASAAQPAAHPPHCQPQAPPAEGSTEEAEGKLEQLGFDAADVPACLQAAVLAAYAGTTTQQGRSGTAGSSGGAEVVFLGTGSAEPSKYRGASGIHVRLEGGQGVLLDCGEGTLGAMCRLYGVRGAARQVAALGCAFISHRHAGERWVRGVGLRCVGVCACGWVGGCVWGGGGMEHHHFCVGVPRNHVIMLMNYVICECHIIKHRRCMYFGGYVSYFTLQFLLGKSRGKCVSTLGANLTPNFAYW